MLEKYLYLILDLLSFVVPFVYSFERKRLHFIQFWKPYFSAILLVGMVFIFWDIQFAKNQVWGFNERYHVGINFWGLPLEEWLFFLLIPYASNFIHYALLYFFPKPELSQKTAQIVAWILLITSVLVAVIFNDRMYTFWSFTLFGALMLLQVIFKFPYFKRYLLSFVVIYIPFFIVNSWLTGSFTDEPIVWYNNSENLGIRLGTIPLEDTFYCFTMLYGSLLLFEFLKKKIL